MNKIYTYTNLHSASCIINLYISNKINSHYTKKKFFTKTFICFSSDPLSEFKKEKSHNFNPFKINFASSCCASTSASHNPLRQKLAQITSIYNFFFIFSITFLLFLNHCNSYSHICFICIFSWFNELLFSHPDIKIT